MSGPDPNAVFSARSRRFQRLGLWVCVAFVVMCVVAGTYIEIGGAVVAPGFVVQTGENRLVQHPEGGPVAEVLVEEGDLVDKGDRLIVLDGAQVASNHRILARRGFELKVRLARVQAQLAKQPHFRVDPAVVETLIAAASVPVESTSPAESTHTTATADAVSGVDRAFAREVVTTQEALFVSYRDRLVSIRERLNTRAGRLRDELAAVARQLQTSSSQIELLASEIAEVSALVAERLVSKARLTGLQRQQVAARAEIDALRVQQERTRTALVDTARELEVTTHQAHDELWQEVNEIQTELEETDASLNAARDRLVRLEITAPEAGRVHELTVKNVNAVISPGDTLLKIVPTSAESVLNSRVALVDIDQISLGQVVRLRFDSFDMSTTPEIEGQVVKISPDRSMDPNTGEMYYEVWVRWPREALAELGDVQIIPGLPATAMFSTGDRTLIDYLTKPLRQQLFASFREG